MRPSPDQKAIDWKRCEDATTLAKCVLPPLITKHGASVSMTTAKLVLAIIDRHGRGSEAWLSFETLAAEVGKSVRTIKRAVEALQAKSLLCVTYKKSPMGFPCNHYQIVWNELALFRNQSRKVQPPDESDILNCQWLDECDTGDTPIRGESDTHVTQTRVRNENNKSRVKNELRYPDFSKLDLSKPEGVKQAMTLLDGEGILFNPEDVAIAASVAVRNGRKPHALFVKILRDGWGKFPPADCDHDSAKEIMRSIGGLVESH